MAWFCIVVDGKTTPGRPAGKVSKITTSKEVRGTDFFGQAARAKQSFLAAWVLSRVFQKS
jgi:hypothetical protein